MPGKLRTGLFTPPGKVLQKSSQQEGKELIVSDGIEQKGVISRGSRIRVQAGSLRAWATRDGLHPRVIQEFADTVELESADLASLVSPVVQPPQAVSNLPFRAPPEGSAG